jgi:hypothetical protein
MWANLRQMPNRLGCLSLALVVAAIVPAFAQQQIPTAGVAQIRALLLDKANRTPAQQKLDSQIIYNSRVALGQPAAPGIPRSFTPSALEKSSDGLIHVDISANVTGDLLSAIVTIGGRVESSFPKYNSVRAWIPLSAAETLAGRADVRFIKPAEYGHTNVGSDTTGVIAHGANIVQAAGITGTGLTIGVLSDGVTALAAEQAAGRLPPVVNVLSGQSGDGPGPCPAPPATPNVCPDEGTAMLEIVYSMAPGATLYFATGEGGEPQMASNIEALQAAGCDIIVDDVTYLDEPAFQDGTIAQAVDAVTTADALYLSSAGNSGNLDSFTSGTWEGDFSPDGSAPPITEKGIVHSFGPTDYDVITTISGPYTLEWSDPYGASCNDYDLFLLDPTGTILEGASTNPQTCSQNPYESISNPAPPALPFPVNSRLVIVNVNNAATRAFHLSTFRGQLNIGTSGATFGHNAAAAALTLAAVRAATADGGIFVGGTVNPPETYSSDGPRKIFYDPSGNPITPGNFLFGTNGGTTLSKVDFTAADCVPSGAPQFTGGFCGTSAAGPHAASIAALIKSNNPALTWTQVKNLMYSTSLVVSGFLPRTVGTGIVMAGFTPTISKFFGASAIPLHSSTSLTFTIANPNTAFSVGGIGFTDILPPGLVVASPSGLTGGCGGGTITAVPGLFTISLSGATLGASAFCTFSLNVTAVSSGVLINVTSPIVSAGGAVGTSATATLTVVAPPTIAKSFAGPTVPLNHTTGLTFDLSNPNGTVSLSGVGFTDTLPSGLIVATPNGLSGSCGGGIITATAGSSSVSLSGTTLGAGGSCTFTVNVLGTVAGIQNNTTSVVTSTQGGNGGTASDSITVVAPPVISKAFAAPTLLVGSSTALSFTIINPNATVPLTAVGFTDTLPSGLVVSTPNGLAGSCGGGTITATSGSKSISLSGATLADSASCTFAVNVTGTIAGMQVNTTGAVTSLDGGTGNQASATITVFAPGLADYFSNANTAGAPDGTVRIINPGTSGGNLCADIFVFDPNQELSECCSCTTTPDGELTLSLNTDLTGNPLTGSLLSTGTITIIPAATIGGLCPLPTAMTPEPALTAWATHIQAGKSGFDVTEGGSQTTAVSAQDLAALSAKCAAVKGVGSGHGVCANSAALAAICNN